jgi:hypothetical protein
MPFATDDVTSDYVVALASGQSPREPRDLARGERATVASAPAAGSAEQRVAATLAGERGAERMRAASSTGEDTALRRLQGRLQGSLDECYRDRSCRSWSGFSNWWARFASRWPVRRWADRIPWTVAGRLRNQRPIWQVGRVGTLADSSVDAAKRQTGQDAGASPVPAGERGHS